MLKDDVGCVQGHGSVDGVGIAQCAVGGPGTSGANSELLRLVPVASTKVSVCGEY